MNCYYIEHNIQDELYLEETGTIENACGIYKWNGLMVNWASYLSVIFYKREMAAWSTIDLELYCSAGPWWVFLREAR